MELARILIRELKDLQIIELCEAEPDADNGGPQAPGKGTAKGPVKGEVPIQKLAPHETPKHTPRSFPIVIGLPEAQAIERRLKGVQIKRPQTHDLLANAITALGGTLESITITDLADHTFFATLDVRTKDGETVNIDSRPSDAIALGIANDVPIYVAEHVLDAAMTEET